MSRELDLPRLFEVLHRHEVAYVLIGGLAATAQGKFLAQTGAVLIKSADGKILGAVGASGGTGDEDEAVCADGVKAAGLST